VPEVRRGASSSPAIRWRSSPSPLCSRIAAYYIPWLEPDAAERMRENGPLLTSSAGLASRSRRDRSRRHTGEEEGNRRESRRRRTPPGPQPSFRVCAASALKSIPYRRTANPSCRRRGIGASRTSKEDRGGHDPVLALVALALLSVPPRSPASRTAFRCAERSQGGSTPDAGGSRGRSGRDPRTPLPLPSPPLSQFRTVPSREACLHRPGEPEIAASPGTLKSATPAPPQAGPLFDQRILNSER